MKLITLLLCLAMTSCVAVKKDEDYLSSVFQPKTQFDWMPNDLTWQNNVRNCRSQPQCNAADLFNKF